jgi:hypothetical protein
VVYDGKTLQVKAIWLQVVEQLCGAGFAGYLIILAPGLGPNGNQLAVSCYKPYGDVAMLDISNITNPVITARFNISIGIESMQINRAGNLVVMGDGSGYPDTPVLVVNTTDGSIISRGTFKDPGFAYRQDLTTDGLTLLMPDYTPQVLAFNITSGALNPTFANIPLAGAACLSIAALYDGSAVVGCDIQSAEQWCAFLVNGMDDNSTTGASNILKKWCITKKELGFASITMGVSREDFLVNLLNAGTFGNTSVPNTFRIRLSDFTVISNYSITDLWNAANAYGALPANQVSGTRESAGAPVTLMYSAKTLPAAAQVTLISFACSHVTCACHE